MTSDKTPYEIANEWYDVDSIWAGIKDGIDAAEIPYKIGSREFAEWLTEQYRLAMMKGIQIGRGEKPR
jgi:hypothetical protein